LQATNMDGAVDGSRVGLWGVSYGGAHVLVTAARFGTNISAVIANVSPLSVPPPPALLDAFPGTARQLARGHR
jgi:pimeloyl-ACP methyl ester carboxylesterase